MNTDAELMALYGPCHVCGAARMHHKFEETDAKGFTQVWSRILCTKEPIKHYGEGSGKDALRKVLREV